MGKPEEEGRGWRGERPSPSEQRFDGEVFRALRILVVRHHCSNPGFVRKWRHGTFMFIWDRRWLRESATASGELWRRRIEIGQGKSGEAVEKDLCGWSRGSPSPQPCTPGAGTDLGRNEAVRPSPTESNRVRPNQSGPWDRSQRRERSQVVPPGWIAANEEPVCFVGAVLWTPEGGCERREFHAFPARSARIGQASQTKSKSVQPN